MNSGGSSGSSDPQDQLGPLLGGRLAASKEAAPGGGGELAEGGLESPPEMSFRLKLLVFVLFTQLGQALMSYDGGATQMSTKALLLSGWSSSELGLLGAMDKFGQVATAFIWSSLLMRFNNKLLLAMGLAVKAGSCIGFGLLSNKTSMLLAKLSMGVSEALIGVWATVWVQANAPRESQARWMGLAGVSAGAGNGAGSAVAGLCSARFGYAFAFVLQGSILFGLWGIMLFTPAYCFEFRKTGAAGAGTATLQATDRSSQDSSRQHLVEHAQQQPAGSEDESEEFSGTMLAKKSISRGPGLKRLYSTDSKLMLQEEVARTMSELHNYTNEGGAPSSSDTLPFWDSLCIVLGSRLWFWTASAISLSCFITSAVAYMWQNTTESVWDFSDKESTFSFLLTTGVGGFVGVAFGPKLFDGYLQGFSTSSGIARCLRWCTRLTIAAFVLGIIAALLFLDTAWHVVHYEMGEQARGGLLGLLLACVFFIFAFLNAMQGTLYGINTDSTTPETKTSAAALTVSMQNIIGFALGPLLPSCVAEVVGNSIKGAWPEEDISVVHSAQFSTGMAVSLFALVPMCFAVHFAARESEARTLPEQLSLEPGAVVDIDLKRNAWSDLEFDPL